MRVDIIHPKMMALRIWISNINSADIGNLFCDFRVVQYRMSQISPVLPLPTRNHIVDRGEGKALMIEMAVQHRSKILKG